MHQKSIHLPSYSRGIHLISNKILGWEAINQYKVGMLQVFIQHTSASLCINENADPEVRHDLEAHLNEMVPENQPYYRHTMEGPDDMPAHIKAVMLGPQLLIPVQNGKAAMGIWQGIYLCEHRNNASGRNLLLTIWGDN